ncbi:HD domain-containing protein [Megasphaera cerevisiae]|uniref:HD domain-containing protein n=1 Tax=Megasphaera cerevisiae TaxID=39029 RepID=UPI00065AA68A|nr:HD domain-containing protein [Megasphaera cerevisiae]SKA02118.1 Predicted HD-superfamily hydrolase [Megasphaera cerevisiae DSM 20462]
MNLEEWMKQPKEVQDFKIKDIRETILTEYVYVLKRLENKEKLKNMIEYLNESTFFTDPSSTKHHCAYPGGLAEHSLNVYMRLYQLVRNDTHFSIKRYPHETLFICGILHDVCKIGTYQIETKWRKDSNGRWESYPTYVWNDNHPLGHGEKSVMILSKYIELSDEEMLAIRWHMGRFDMACDSYSGLQLLGAAQRQSPLVTALHLADMEATWFDETEYQ